MFWIRHPRPLPSTRAVAMQVVQRRAQAMSDTRLIIIEKAAADPNAVDTPPPCTDQAQDASPTRAA